MKDFIKWCLTLVMVSLQVSLLQGGHLVAGTMHYSCVRKEGNNLRLKVVLRIVRDCRIEDPIGFFDSSPQSSITGTVSVYAGTESRPVQIIVLSAPVVTKVFPVPTYPCLEPPNEYCLEQGEYMMDVSLPIINESYFIIYQRCCRSPIIQNISSAQSTGVSYWLEITPAGQQTCNSSPAFQDFPPLTTCVSQTFTHPLGINDVDQDDVRLRIAAPYHGGGPSNPPAALNGIAPNPDAPPPYDTVKYIRGYSGSQPLGSTGLLTLQEKNLTGRPGQLGTYLIGLNIEDHRQGVLLSRSGIDLQINVVSCAPLVQASVVGRANATLDTFTIDQCGPGPLAIINNSTQRANIKNWKWQWNIQNQDPALSTWNAEFPDLSIGTYFGRLSLNTQEICKDEAVIKVNVFPAITSDFQLPDLTCAHAPLTFRPQIQHQAPLRSTSWTVSPGATKQFTDRLTYLFPQPGKYQVTLDVLDQNGCSAQTKRDLLYAPLDSTLLHAESPLLICVPDTLDLNPFTFLRSNLYQFFWDYGFGTSTALDPRITFGRRGVYDLKYQITSPTGCVLQGILPGHFQAEDKPQADFTAIISGQQGQRSLLLAAQDLGSGPLDYSWWINSTQVASGDRYRHAIPTFGTYNLRLDAINAAGCTTAVHKSIELEPLVQFYLPNIFSPNDDGVNDLWQPVGWFEGITALKYAIFDRWGTLIFSSTDPQQAWDGRFLGQSLPAGVYAAVLQYLDAQGKLHLVSESITLLR